MSTTCEAQAEQDQPRSAHAHSARDEGRDIQATLTRLVEIEHNEALLFREKLALRATLHSAYPPTPTHQHAISR